MKQYTPNELAQRTVARRAVEAVIWGMPAVNFDLMYQSMVKAGGAFNQIVYWSRLPSWKNQTLTPNPDTIYVFPFFDTKDVGPDGAGDPAGEDGGVDHRQRSTTPGSGAGGRRPRRRRQGQRRQVPHPAAGYTEKARTATSSLPSDTYRATRCCGPTSESGSEADIAKAVAYGKRVKFYPLSQAANPPPTTSSTPSTSSSTAPSPTTCASSRRSTASCSASPGSSATRR